MLKAFIGLILGFWNALIDSFTNLGDFFKKVFFKIFPAKHQRQYLKSLLTHKYWVFVAGRKIGVPVWQLVVHDWSKFLPDEFNAYADMFFNKELQAIEASVAKNPIDGSMLYPYFGYHTKERFSVAWLKHQRRNPHHWQYWYLVQDNDPWIALPMPIEYLMEMLVEGFFQGSLMEKFKNPD